MRKQVGKECISRYADDFRIFCRNKEDALRTKEAVTAWINREAEAGGIARENKDSQC